MKALLWLIGMLGTLLLPFACNEAPAGGMSKATAITLPAQQPEYKLICQTLKSIPAPVESATLLRRNAPKFDEALLNSPARSSSYATSSIQALNLGIYGADMAYCNLYQRHYTSLDYLLAIERLAEKLHVESAIDLRTIERLVSSAGNLDSLLSVVNISLNDISFRFQERGQLSLSLMMVTGGWLEGLHLLAAAAKANPNPALIEKIGEQRLVLSQLIALLSQMQQNSEQREVHDALVAIKRAYNGVKISETYVGESQIKEVNGIPTFIDNRQTAVEMQPETLIAIAKATNEARKSITIQ